MDKMIVGVTARQMRESQKPVLSDASLYLCDNGACYCGLHCGNTARYTGHDISGQKVQAVTPPVLAEARSMGWEPKCEECGRTASALFVATR